MHGQHQAGSRLSMATVSDHMSSPSAARSSLANGRSSRFQSQMGSVSTLNNAGNSMASERSSSSRGSGVGTPKDMERKQRHRISATLDEAFDLSSSPMASIPQSTTALNGIGSPSNYNVLPPARLTGGARKQIVSRHHSSKSLDPLQQNGDENENKMPNEWDISSMDNDADSAGHDSDTGMESMSSTELQHSAGSHSHQSHRTSCSFCIDTSMEEEQKRLNELVHDFDRLKTEKEDLLMQNVTCKTDIKKLKQRQSMLSSELERAQDEIQRLRRMLKRPSNGSDSSSSHCSTGSSAMRPDRPPLEYHVFSP